MRQKEAIIGERMTTENAEYVEEQKKSLFHILKERDAMKNDMYQLKNYRRRRKGSELMKKIKKLREEINIQQMSVFML